MSELMVFVGSFAASGLLTAIAWGFIRRAVAAENAVELEDWERG